MRRPSRHSAERLGAHQIRECRPGAGRVGVTLSSCICVCQTYWAWRRPRMPAASMYAWVLLSNGQVRFRRSPMMPNRRSVGGSESDRTHVSTQTLQRICCRRAAHGDALRQQHSHQRFPTTSAISECIHIILRCLRPTPSDDEQMAPSCMTNCKCWQAPWLARSGQ